jgi:NADH-quinone oxidoreductase subunit N
MLPEIKIVAFQLESILRNSGSLIPEIFISGVLLATILFDLIFKNTFIKLLPALFCMTLMGTMASVIVQFQTIDAPLHLFFNSLLLDKKALYFKILFDVATLVFIAYGFLKPSHGNAHTFYRKTEFYVVLSGILLGLHLLSMASSLLTAYLALEMISIGGYILATFGFNKTSAEAGIKYLLFGAVSSAMMLYGMSWLYGMTGSLDFPEVFVTAGPLGIIVLMLTLAGVFFKIAAAPFHLWAPDVYEGIPAPLAAYFSIAPKAAGFALLINMLRSFSGQSLLTSGSLGTCLAVIAMATIAIGNFSALWQNNAKRLLAYSSIAHTGFALTGLVVLSGTGTEACLYYLGIYLFMNFTAFLMVDFLSESIGSEDVNKFKGLGMQVPLLGVIFVFTMIALTGLPPTAGFYAKVLVFSVLWESYSLTAHPIFLLLFIFGLFNTVISLFYYLKIPYLMFFKNSEAGARISSSFATNTFFGLLAAPLLVLFLKPDLLLEYINNLFK